MKKLLALILALGLAISFAGCATEKKAEVLTVALSPDFAPMEFVDSSKSGQAQYVGFDVMLANHIANELGMTLEIKPMSFDACQTAVQLGSVDMSISGFSWTAEREENYLISDYYIAGDNETEQVIITLADKAGTMTTVEDFAGLTVGAQAASLQEKLCQEVLADTVTLMPFKSIDDAVLALQTGKIDVLAVARGNGEAIIANNPGLGFTGFQFEVDPKYENNVILLNKASTELLKKVNDILADCLASGIYETWYSEALVLAGVETAVETSYDDEGNVAG